MSRSWTSARAPRRSTAPEAMDRWRGRRLAGLALAGVIAISAGGGAPPDAGSGWVVVRDAHGVELARAPLTGSEGFALRYRNSLYHSIAQERFEVVGSQLRLVSLEAQEPAVLEEYYGAFGAERDASGSDLAWSVAVERPPISLPLRVQATRLGERTLVTHDGPVPLWRLVAGRDDTLVILTIEGA